MSVTTKWGFVGVCDPVSWLVMGTAVALAVAMFRKGPDRMKWIDIDRRFVDIAIGPELDAVGGYYGCEREPDESDADYRARLLEEAAGEPGR